MTDSKIYKDLFKGYPHEMREVEVLSSERYSEYWDKLKELIESGKIQRDSVVVWWVG